jgi:hypothetical protein
MLTPALNCVTYNYTVINTTGKIEKIGDLTNIYSNIYYFNFTLSKGNYIVQLCDGTTREVVVAEKNEGNMIIAIMILIPIILGIMLLFGSFALNPEHTPIKIFMLLLSFLSFFVSMHFGLISIIKFYDFPELQDLIGSTTEWAVLAFILLFSYFIIYFLYQLFKSFKEKKMSLRY